MLQCSLWHSSELCHSDQYTRWTLLHKCLMPSFIHCSDFWKLVLFFAGQLCFICKVNYVPLVIVLKLFKLNGKWHYFVIPSLHFCVISFPVITHENRMHCLKFLCCECIFMSITETCLLVRNLYKIIAKVWSSWGSCKWINLKSNFHSCCIIMYNVTSYFY